jgi:hypothetical protein
MIRSKLGSAGIWSSEFSTSIFISRPTRLRRTGTAFLLTHRKIKRPGKQLGKSVSGDNDVDTIRSDFDVAKEGHEHRSDLVWRLGPKFFRALTATLHQLALCDATVRFIVDGIEHCSVVSQERAEPIDHQTFQIAGWNPPAV